MTSLALPLTDLEPLRRRVAALAEQRPAVYRMLDARGRVIYVGKAKRLRPRLLSYFRAAETLTFVYTDPGAFGDARAYIIRRATVRASAPAPHSPIEREALRALVAEHAAPEPAHRALPVEAIDETLLLSWFRRHSAFLRRTVPLEHWL